MGVLRLAALAQDDILELMDKIIQISSAQS
jgi:hypothetical protein